MFKVKASYSEQFEVRASAAKVREFFADTRNFVELMAGIESIRAGADGVTHWKIRAEIPFLGAMTETFDVKLSENSENLIEWTPAASDAGNLLRYAADFAEEDGRTKIHISQTVEVRREKASDLHMLAGWAGETIISQQMQSRVETMIKTFFEAARKKLEKGK